MFTKKFYLTFVAVFITLEVTGFILYMWLMGDTWKSEEVAKFLRPEADWMGKMWIVYLTDLIWSFFFTFFFVKGYENKGIAEGIRFGIYIGLFFSLVMAYQSYVFYPWPYWVTFQMFVYGLIQAILCGVVAALVYKPKAQAV